MSYVCQNALSSVIIRAFLNGEGEKVEEGGGGGGPGLAVWPCGATALLGAFFWPDKGGNEQPLEIPLHAHVSFKH